MENKITQLMAVNESDRSPAEREALRLHERLVYDKQMVEVGIVSMCRDLKDIRDGKHYQTLGFDDFGEYTEQMHGIGARQAYKYIRIYEQLGIEILNSSSKIGVTKLLELASLDSEERRELLAAHPIDELEDMSTAEVKRLTAEVHRLEEQISFFENNENLNSSSKPEQSDDSELRAEIEQQVREEYEARLQEQAVAIQKKNDVLAELRDDITAVKVELKQTKADLNSSSKVIKEAQDRAKQAEDAAAQAIELEGKIKDMEAQRAEMEKQIRLSSDPELTRFKYLFESWQTATNTMFEQLGKLDEATQEKMRAAINAVMGERL